MKENLCYKFYPDLSCMLTIMNKVMVKNFEDISDILNVV